MTLSELINEVYLITNRPDLVNQTSSAVRAATLKIHHTDFYHKDLRETGINFSTPAYQQQFEYKTILPYWRALKYFRKSDATGEGLAFFEIILPELSLDDYAINREDVVYSAGTVLQIRSTTLVEYCIVGYYRHPDITALGYESWIAEDFPFAIIYEASAQIFKQTGDTEQYAAFTQLAREQIALVARSSILVNGW